MARAGAGIFDKLEPEPEPHKNGPAPQHWYMKVRSYGNFVGRSYKYLLKLAAVRIINKSQLIYI
jgi:hypothetical protein